MANFWTNKLDSEVGAVLGFNENDHPYKINNLFDYNPFELMQRIEQWS